MNQPINTGIQEVAPPVQAPAPKISPLVSVLSKISGLIPQKTKDLWLKFYSNKKIFVPVAAAFGLVFLTIVAGLIFGSVKPTAVPSKTTPTPWRQSGTSPQSTPGGDIVTDTENQLNSIKTQINNLDVKQSRLTPPSLNFEIKF